MKEVGVPPEQLLAGAQKRVEAACLQQCLGVPSAARWAARRVACGGPSYLPGRASGADSGLWWTCALPWSVLAWLGEVQWCWLLPVAACSSSLGRSTGASDQLSVRGPGVGALVLLLMVVRDSGWWSTAGVFDCVTTSLTGRAGE